MFIIFKLHGIHKVQRKTLHNLWKAGSAVPAGLLRGLTSVYGSAE